jgi:hypothetical protein
MIVNEAKDLTRKVGTKQYPQFMVNPSLTSFFSHDKMGRNWGVKGKISLNIPRKVQHLKQNKITDTGRED